MAILWAVEMEGEDYKTGHCNGERGKRGAKKGEGRGKRNTEASKTMESAEDRGWGECE